MEKYFKLTSNTKINIFGIKLYQLQLTIDCKWGKKGDLGGWVESENLKSGNARISGNAWIYGNAQIYGDAFENSPLQIQGTMNFITECKKGYLQIGCICKSLKEWKLQFKAIGKENGYSQKQIKEYGLYIELAIRLSKLK